MKKSIIDKIDFFDTWFIAYLGIFFMILSMATIPANNKLEITGIFFLMLCILIELMDHVLIKKVWRKITLTKWNQK